MIDYPFEASIPAQDGLQDGGSTILSLNLQWDQGLGGATQVTLIGESPHSTTNSYTVQLAPDGSSQGHIYKFRVRALNIHGWSEPSDWATVLAADVPGVVQSS